MTDDELISLWAGLECLCEGDYWGNCPMHGQGGKARPYTTDDDLAPTLICLLSERGYSTILTSTPKGKRTSFRFCILHIGLPIFTSSFGYSLSKTVSSMVLKLIKKERKA